MGLQEKIARWLWDEYGDWWSWDKMPQRKKDYYMGKAAELVKDCGLVIATEPIVCEELIQSMYPSNWEKGA